jgi:predicted oxidoreductase
VVFGLDADAAAYREDAAAALSQALSEAQRVRENMSIRIVCGFIAEVLANEAQHGGLSPETTFNISSFTVLKIVEALKEAGYSPHGKTPF